jgi:hypothetical protein
MDQPYQTFIFDAFSFEQSEGRIELRYSLDDTVKFLETIELAGGLEYQQVPLEIMDRALLALHLIGGTSYYKTCVPEQIAVRSGALFPPQVQFWNTVYEQGLAEFAYVNKLNLAGRIHFPGSKRPPLIDKKRPKDAGRILVPIGGGKDSLVTIEILRRAGFDVTLLRMGSHPLIDTLVEAIGLPVITVERTLSPELFALNEKGAMNGHVPVTAYLSFLSVLIALLYGFETIVMSNERSADEENTQSNGNVVNHQWSKSFAFEQMCQAYIRDYITKDLRYFSLLRHIGELAVVRYFSTLPQYFDKVTSCNRNWRILKEQPSERWCGECRKCASSFALFAAFLPKEELLRIFGKNLFAETTLRIVYRELLGVEGIKPFECVATVDEMRIAFLLAHERGDLDDTAMMQMFLADVLPLMKNPEALKEHVLSPGSQHAIPPEFLSALHAH